MNTQPQKKMRTGDNTVRPTTPTRFKQVVLSNGKTNWIQCISVQPNATQCENRTGWSPTRTFSTQGCPPHPNPRSLPAAGVCLVTFFITTSIQRSQTIVQDQGPFWMNNSLTLQHLNPELHHWPILVTQSSLQHPNRIIDLSLCTVRHKPKPHSFCPNILVRPFALFFVCLVHPLFRFCGWFCLISRKCHP